MKESSTVIINEILDRNNYINQQSPRRKHQHHIVAANPDPVPVDSYLGARTSQGFIDRFLLATEMYHALAVIAFNKSDLYKAEGSGEVRGWKAM
ncbi:MAG: hypothetical protein IPL27_19245 [Lewinellaceae bacterium]|nr:hypothetical protein [Lewinellaceae bacterium]